MARFVIKGIQLDNILITVTLDVRPRCKDVIYTLCVVNCSINVRLAVKSFDWHHNLE